MKEDIAIYGAGGLGRELALMIQQINRTQDQWNIIGFFDDGLKRDDKIDSWKIVGGLSEACQWKQPLAIVIAIADPQVRAALASKLKSTNLTFPTLIHPTCNRGDEQRNQIGRAHV